MASILLDEEEDRLYDEEVGPEPTTRHYVEAEWSDLSAERYPDEIRTWRAD